MTQRCRGTGCTNDTETDLCAHCMALLPDLLAAIPSLYLRAASLLAPGARGEPERVGGPPGGPRAPLNLPLLARLDAARAQLVSWARVIALREGDPLPGEKDGIAVTAAYLFHNRGSLYGSRLLVDFWFAMFMTWRSMRNSGADARVYLPLNAPCPACDHRALLMLNASDVTVCLTCAHSYGYGTAVARKWVARPMAAQPV